MFFMATGYALIEAGSVRNKNTLNVLLKNIMHICISGIVWWAWGYAFAFGNVNGGFIGNKYFFGMGMDSDN
jgi:Amt family ammonium transporter